MLDIDFDDLHVNLTDSPIGCCVGGFEGSFSVDLSGNVESITFSGYIGRKSNWHTVDVPHPSRNDLSDAERFIRKIADALESEHDRTIKEQINEWHMTRRDGPEHDANEAYA